MKVSGHGLGLTAYSEHVKNSEHEQRLGGML